MEKPIYLQDLFANSCYFNQPQTRYVVDKQPEVEVTEISSKYLPFKAKQIFIGKNAAFVSIARTFIIVGGLILIVFVCCQNNNSCLAA